MRNILVLSEEDDERHLDTPTGESRGALLLDCLAIIANTRGLSREVVDARAQEMLAQGLPAPEDRQLK